MFHLFTLLLMILFLIVSVTQILIPAWNETPMFWLFRGMNPDGSERKPKRATKEK